MKLDLLELNDHILSTHLKEYTSKMYCVPLLVRNKLYFVSHDIYNIVLSTSVQKYINTVQCLSLDSSAIH